MFYFSTKHKHAKYVCQNMGNDETLNSRVTMFTMKIRKYLFYMILHLTLR